MLGIALATPSARGDRCSLYTRHNDASKPGQTLYEAVNTGRRNTGKNTATSQALRRLLG